MGRGSRNMPRSQNQQASFLALQCKRQKLRTDCPARGLRPVQLLGRLREAVPSQLDPELLSHVGGGAPPPAACHRLLLRAL